MRIPNTDNRSIGQIYSQKAVNLPKDSHHLGHRKRQSSPFEVGLPLVRQFDIGQVEQVMVVFMPELYLCVSSVEFLQGVDLGNCQSRSEVLWIHPNDSYIWIIQQMSAQNQPGNEGLFNCAEELGKLPFFTRLLYFSLAISWFLELISGLPSALFESSVSSTFSSFYLWTLLTCNFCVDSLFLLTIVVFNFHTFLPKLEERYSTIVVATKFIVNGMVVALLTLLIQAAIGYEKYPLNGVAGIWFNMLTKYCFFNAEREIKFCCFGWKVRKTIYPFVLLAILSLITFSIPVPMIVGLMYGVLEVKAERIFCLLSSKGLFNKLGGLIRLESIKCWIQYIEERGPEDFKDSTLYTNLQNYQLGSLGSGDALERSAASDPFAKKGMRIGDY